VSALNFDIIARDRASKVFDQIGSKSAKTEQNLSKLGSGSSVIFRKITGALAGVVTGWQAWDKVMVGGFNRLANLDDARKRLDQMGLSTAEAQKLMDGLTETVTGTAFSLDAGAGAMTGFVSAGTDLDEVNSRLEMTADTAAFAQAPLDEIGNIFVKIQSQGKIMGEELNMLQERGVPALLLLADAAGVTAEQMRDMISRGEIDAERFFDLWEQGSKGFGENNLKIEGAAKSMGDTIRGSLANAETALARLGAEILDDFVPAIKEGADAFKDFANVAINALDEVDQFAKKTGLETATEKIKEFNVTGAEFFEMLGRSAEKSNDAIGSFFEDVFGVENVSLMTILADESEETSRRFQSAMGGAKSSADGLTDALAESAAQAEAANAHLGAYIETLQRATDPVFALSSAIDEVAAANAAYDEVLGNVESTQADVEAAALKVAQAVSKAEAAAINGDLSFADFDAKLRQWVRSGAITAGQADNIRSRVESLTAKAKAYEGNYNATVTADTAGAYTAVDSLVRWIGGRRATIGVNIRTFGAGALEFHEGGIIGAPRAHSGMLLGGLSADERLVVGQTGERILSRRGTRALDALTDELGRSRIGGGTATSTASGMDPRAMAREFVRELRQAGLVMPRTEIARRADLYARSG
jgi:tape measure domain-containing protein